MTGQEKNDRLILALTEKVADLEAENEMLRRMLTEADRNNAFRRYHRGAKS